MKKRYTQEKFWKIVNKLLNEAELIIEVLDARFPYQTKNSVLEGKLKKLKIPCIRVITKADLVSKQKLDKAAKKLKAIKFSARTRINTKILIQEIMKHYNNLKKKFIEKNKGKKITQTPYFIKVGVLGYPNIGKSSLINTLKGRKAAPTSPVAGYTKGKQWVKITSKILLIDTPGVIPFKEKNQLKLILKSAVTDIKNPEQTAIDLIEIIPKNKLESFYKIKTSNDSEQTLETIAIKKHLIKKRNIPDLKRAGLMLINDIQKNKLKLF